MSYVFNGNIFIKGKYFSKVFGKYTSESFYSNPYKSIGKFYTELYLLIIHFVIEVGKRENRFQKCILQSR